MNIQSSKGRASRALRRETPEGRRGRNAGVLITDLNERMRALGAKFGISCFGRRNEFLSREIRSLKRTSDFRSRYGSDCTPAQRLRVEPRRGVGKRTQTVGKTRTSSHAGTSRLGRRTGWGCRGCKRISPCHRAAVFCDPAGERRPWGWLRHWPVTKNEEVYAY